MFREDGKGKEWGARICVSRVHVCVCMVRKGGILSTTFFKKRSETMYLRCLGGNPPREKQLNRISCRTFQITMLSCRPSR